MTWYAASIIQAIRPAAEGEKPIRVYESLYLIEAASEEEAFAESRKIGESESAKDDSLTLNGVAAKTVFVGVRKLISVSNPAPLRQKEDRPVSGTELTYSCYEVADEEALKKLAEGERVIVDYVE
jgi:hypothetical protein